MLHALPLLLLATTPAVPPVYPEVTFYVAPTGNDVWSGRSAVRKGGDGPFATPDRARDAVREYRKAKGKAEQVTVVVAGGRYELAEPLVFGPEDSGDAGRLTRFVAADGAKPVLSGGVRVTGWKPAANGVWTAPLPKGSDPGVRHVSVNGGMRFRPRLPKRGWYTIAGLAGADPKAKYVTPADRFEFNPGEIRADWKNLTDVEVVALHFWVDPHFKIAGVDPDRRVVTLDRPTRRRLTEAQGPHPARYYLTNVAEALTEPGEFYVDRAAGTISYLPKPGEDMTTAEVVVPRLPAVVRFDGKPGEGKFVECVVLRGLTFADSTWELPPKDAGDTQAASLAPGAVRMRGAQSCLLEDCRVVNVGGYGIDVADGCHDVFVVGCEVVDVGAGGIRVNGGAAGSPDAQRTRRTRIRNNHLHRLGRLFHSGVGVLVMHADKNTIARNHIHDLYYTGISVGWVWGYKPSVSAGNVIEFNRIHDVGQRLLSDMGGVYTLGVSPGTVVRGNVIHDVDAYTYGGWGIYTDEGSTGILIEKNLVYRTKTGGFHQHYGKENVVRNNVFALAREDQVQRSRAEPHVSFTFEGNVVYYTSGTLLGKIWKDDRFVMDRNLYWNAAGNPVVFPGGLTLEQWQARGFDRHSAVAEFTPANLAWGLLTRRLGPVPGSAAARR